MKEYVRYCERVIGGENFFVQTASEMSVHNLSNSFVNNFFLFGSSINKKVKKGFADKSNTFNFFFHDVCTASLYPSLPLSVKKRFKYVVVNHSHDLHSVLPTIWEGNKVVFEALSKNLVGCSLGFHLAVSKYHSCEELKEYFPKCQTFLGKEYIP